tara:strand:- start:3967 stop:5103 length:1137 start_codon:yes stop_codon:yes gene_type:complete
MYSIYILISIILLLFIILRLFNRFWSTQPIFHFYNIWYWLFPPGLIHINLPKKTKFYDKNIVCETTSNLSTEKKALLVSFIQSHFQTPKEIVKYNYDKNYILENLNYQKKFSHVSFQYDLLNNKLIGCLTTRLLCGYINKQKIFISFMDFLCIRDKYYNSNIGYNQIFTHYLKSRELNAPPIFLFKRSKKLKLLVPLTIYNSYSFDSNKLNKINILIPQNVSCHIIKSYNFQIFKDFSSIIQNKFNCFIIPSFVNIKNLIDKNILFIFIIKDGINPIGTIIYKKTCISFKNKVVINCIASYCKEGYEEILKDSVSNTVVLLKKKIKFDLINFENTSFNYIIIKSLLRKFSPKGKLLSCYYFYNFVTRPLKSKNIFIVE